MPDPDNNEKNSKYGKLGVAEQYSAAFFAAAMVLDHFDKKADTQMKEWRRKNNEKFTVVSVEHDTPVKHTFKTDVKDEKTAVKLKEKMSGLKKTFSKLLKSKSPEKKAFGGYFKFCEKLCDTEAGDYSRAITENPYLNELTVRMQGFAHFKENETVSDKIKKLGGNGPLEPLNTYYSVLSDLYDREYEKQKIMADYSPEKEAAYLRLLDRDFKKILDNHPKIEALVNEDGKSDYDKDLGEPLAIMTDKADRSCKWKIENIRGQKKAIENKWGMNELGVLGSLSELKFECDNEKKKLQKESSNETFDARKQDYLNRIKENETSKRNYEEQLRIKEEEVKNIADLAEKQKKQQDIEKVKKSIEKCDKKINAFNEEIIKFPDQKKELEEKLKKLNAFSDKVNALHDSAMNKVVESPQDKMDIAVKLGTLLDEGLTVDNKCIVNSCTASKRIMTQAAEYGFMKPEKVKIDESVEERVFNDEMSEEYKAFGVLFSKNNVPHNMNEAIMKYDPLAFYSLDDRRSTFITDYRETKCIPQEINMGAGEELRGELGGALEFKSTAVFSDKMDSEKYFSEDIARSFNDSFTRILTSLKGDEKELSRCIASASVCADLDRGNFIKASVDQPYLAAFFAQTGGSPMVCSKEHSATEVRKWLEEINAFDPIIDYYQSGKELYEIEFEKQKMQKDGWNEKKEKLYLSKLHENFSKSIEAFEKLQIIPIDLQSEDRGLSGNTIGELTGVSKNTAVNRDANPAIGMLKWQKKAIENGASSRDLNVFAFGGLIEGYLTRGRIKTEAEIYLLEEKMKGQTEEKQKESQKTIEKYKKKLDALNKWENEHFKPFKESILGRQIKSSSDMLNIITEMKSFYDKHKDNPDVGKPAVQNQSFIDKPYDLFTDAYNATFDYIIPKCINNCMEDIKTGNKAAYPPEKLPIDLEKNDKSMELSEYLKGLRSGNFTDKKDLKMIASTYLRDRFLNGMNKAAHPEYFDTKNSEYKIRMNRLDQYTEQYAGRMLEVLGPKDGKELADMLEFGNHGSVFYEMNEKMRCDVKKSRMDALISGKPERKSKAKGIEECIENLKNSKAAWGSSSGMYDNIIGEINDVVKARKEIEVELKRKYETKQLRNFRGYFKRRNGKTDQSKPLYDFKNPVKVDADPEKIKDFIAKQEHVYSRIKTYLSKKDELIRKAGGNPEKEEDIDRLGKNGARRYRAMRDAKKAILNQYQATVEFDNDGPTYGDRLRIEKGGFDLKPEEYIDKSKMPDKKKFADDASYNQAFNKAADDAKKSFVAEEKQRFLDHMHCNMNRRNAELEKNAPKKAHNAVL